MKVLLLTLCALLAACATQPETKWYKAGASNTEFSTDQGQCQAQAFGVTGAPMMQVAIVFNSCMRGKGWVLR